MEPKKKRLRQDEPARYEIVVQGRLRPDWQDSFGELHMEVIRELGDVTMTKLSGVVMDQAALHGLLNRLRDLGLVLLLVVCLDFDQVICKRVEEK
jgi:hypothetical protein